MLGQRLNASGIYEGWLVIPCEALGLGKGLSSLRERDTEKTIQHRAADFIDTAMPTIDTKTIEIAGRGLQRHTACAALHSEPRFLCATLHSA